MDPHIETELVIITKLNKKSKFYGSSRKNNKSIDEQAIKILLNGVLQNILSLLAS